MKVGDSIVVGAVSGRVRSMMDDKGKQVKNVTPGYAVEVMGLGGVPEAGDQFDTTETEEQAREIAEVRELKRKKDAESSGKHTMEQILA